MDSKGFVPCKVYFERGTKHELVLETGKTARVDKILCRFPLDQDIRDQDRLGDVTDRRNRLLYRGPFVIRNPIRRHRYIEVLLEGHGVGS